MTNRTNAPRDTVRVPAKACLCFCILVALALRMYRLGQQPLSWDEGWSIGLSNLSWGAINRVTALDVHPPLYYDLFKLWLGLGRNELLMRFLSVVAGTLTIPLAYVTGRVWARSAQSPALGSRDASQAAESPALGSGDASQHEEALGLWAAGITAISPFLLYYAQVARMYALCAALALLATYLLLRATETGKAGFYFAFVLSATASLYTFYYTALVLAAAYLYAFVVRPRRLPALVASGAAVALLYAPWLLYAIPPMLSRVGSRTGMVFSAADALRFLTDGVFGLVFAYAAGWAAVYVVLALLALGLGLALRRREWLRSLLLPTLAIVLTLLAVSVGAKVHMFAARYLIPASPFLALLIAWALTLCWRRARCLAVLGLLVLTASSLPTLTRYVYAKSYEISGAFDPQADYRYLRDKTRADDVVFFNVLSLAGLYERFRTPADPAWSYVLRWDPVIEPLETALAERVQPAASQHRSLWLVLYKGTVAANLPLKEWFDLNLFPAFGQWREDTLYLQYLSPTPDMAQAEPGLTFGGRIHLQSAAFTSQAQADDRVTVRLVWSASEGIPQNLKVFVHLYSSDGRLVTQHDAVPVNELRPTTGWQPGEAITDNHGLWLPLDTPGVLHLVVGLYDPQTNTRLLLSDGSDHAEIGVVQVAPRAQ